MRTRRSSISSQSAGNSVAPRISNQLFTLINPEYCANYVIGVETILPKQIIAHKHGIGDAEQSWGKDVSRGPKGQPRQAGVAGPAAVTLALIIPNRKLKLLDQVREG